METATTTIESPNAGKGGEPTAAASSAASSRTIDPKNLTPVGVSSLLASAFAAEPAVEAPAAEPGEEVRPGTDEIPPTTPESETPEPGESAPETPETTATPHEGQLPEHLEAELAQWEERGGTLPASLQKLVERRIGKMVGEREAASQRATTAEAEVTRLQGELEQAQQRQPTAPAAPGQHDEKSLTALVDVSTRFKSDARAYLGGYASEEQKARIEKHMADSNQDENGIRRQLDEVSDWLTQEAPQLKQQLVAFKSKEAASEPVAKTFFPWLGNKEHPDGKLAAEILELVPELKQRTPAWKIAAGVWTLGFKEYQKLTAAANAKGNGAVKPGALPGKAPAKAPTGGSPAANPRLNGKAAEQEANSQRLRENPTAENVMASLASALR